MKGMVLWRQSCEALVCNDRRSVVGVGACAGDRTEQQQTHSASVHFSSVALDAAIRDTMPPGKKGKHGNGPKSSNKRPGASLKVIGQLPVSFH